MINRSAPNVVPRWRAAFSLLEVIIATGILATSAALLLSLFSTGERHATRAESRVVAQMICQSKLDEILATGVLPESVEDQPLPTHPEWTYSLDWTFLEVEGLVRVRVSVKPVSEPTQIGRGRSPDVSREPTFELVRWMRYRPTHDASSSSPGTLP